jgi:diguanylate cyclase (GGDEF)-like protein/PAS domain S-box-containing protein
MSVEAPLRLATARRPLRTYLLALIFLALTPAIAAISFAVWYAGSAFREASTAQLRDTVRTITRAVEGELEHRTAFLSALAAAPVSTESSTMIDSWLEGGRVVTEPAPAADATGFTASGIPVDTLRKAAATSLPIISDLFLSSQRDVPKIAISVARPNGSTPVQILTLLIEPQHLIRSLQQRGASLSNVLMAVTDGTGRIVARSRAPERFIGQSVPGWNNLKAVGGSEGSFTAAAAEGANVVFAFQSLLGTPGWVVVVGEPLKVFDARWQQPLVGLAIGCALAILFALLATTRIARIVLRPIQSLAQHAASIVDGQGKALPVAAVESPIAEFEALRTSIESAETTLLRQAQTEREIASEMAASERRYRAVSEVGALVFWRRSPTGHVISATGWTELTGHPESDAFGNAWLNSIHPSDRAIVDAVWAEANDRRITIDVEFRVAAADGQWRWVRARGAPITDESQTIVEWVGVLEDVDARRQAQARVAHMAHHDALTGLPNRVLFQERMEEAVSRASRGQPEAILCLDLDRFKEVNDTLGHPVGDALLCAVTERLRAAVRDSDTIARLGGDEFAILQTAAPQPVGSSALAERLVRELSRPYDLMGHQAVIGVSVGIALINAGEEGERALQNADMALYRAKEEGRGRFYFFEPAMDARMQKRRKMELALRRAMAEREFEVYYQPLMKASSRSLVAFEALLRWNHPELGQVQPSDFIPMAEEIGLIVALGEWVLEEACSEAAKWPEHVGVAVNVSPVQLASRALPDSVSRALQSSGLAPQRLELEITENALIDDIAGTTATLFRLKSLGVRITMDDFGTGCSSLGYLRAFPFDKIKIDKSFVLGLGEQQESRAIIKAVTGLCESLGITTTAEGVETQAQLDFLLAEQCTEVQGFLFSKPCRASEIADLCRALDPANQAKPKLRLLQPGK